MTSNTRATTTSSAWRSSNFASLRSHRPELLRTVRRLHEVGLLRIDAIGDPGQCLRGPQCRLHDLQAGRSQHVAAGSGLLGWVPVGATVTAEDVGLVNGVVVQ